MLLQLQMLLQALQDILSFELGLPLDGLNQGDSPDDIYDESLVLISRYPRLLKRWRTEDKQKWLTEITNVRQDLGLKTRRCIQSCRGSIQQHATAISIV